MAKFALFSLLWFLLGNPFVAIIVLLIIAYILDRRFIGLSPSLMRPIKRRQRIGKLKQELALSPHNLSAKQELGHLLIESKCYREAREVLEPIRERMDQSAEYLDDLGTAYLHTGDSALGEAAIREALELNPRVKYGEPYLRLASLYSASDKTKALHELNELRSLNSSSCEVFYRMGILYGQMERMAEAKGAWQEAIRVYQGLPKYLRRKERGWMIRSRFKSMGS